MQRIYEYNKYAYRNKVTMINYIVMGLFAYSVFKIASAPQSTWTVIWILALVVSLYTLYNSFVRKSNPRLITISDDTICFASYGEISFETEKLSMFRVKVTTPNYQILVRIEDTNSRKGTFWVTYSFFNDKLDLISEFDFLERKVHPDSLRFRGRGKMGASRPKKRPALSCVLCDLDGTLLDNRGKISAADLLSIKKCKEKGIPFFLVTGRHHVFAKDICQKAGFEYPVCSSNGGHIYNYETGETLYLKTIEDGPSQKIYAYLNEHKLDFAAYTKEKVVFARKDGIFKYWKKQNENYKKENRFTPFFVDTDFDIKKEAVVKYFISFDYAKPQKGKTRREAVIDLEKVMNELFLPDELCISRSGPATLDINAAGVDKGAAFFILSRLYDFETEGALAMGDSCNDIGLLKAAGVAIAPAKAESGVKAIAAYISTTNNDSPLTHALTTLYPGIV
ncbi:MAG: HAD family hydrolase [Treponema sp.]|jgi:Cof subfamily protein (haloacid dehalogenase superfamily)|nr:HAD family hydrolase [Treponema sp.]